MDFARTRGLGGKKALVVMVNVLPMLSRMVEGHWEKKSSSNLGLCCFFRWPVASELLRCAVLCYAIYLKARLNALLNALLYLSLQ